MGRKKIRQAIKREGERGSIRDIMGGRVVGERNIGEK